MANESPYIMPGVPKNNYELAVEAGFVGTLEEWIASWPKGEPGEPGERGPRGPEGTVTPELLAAKSAAEAASVSSWNARNEAVSARNTAIEAALDAESHKDAVEAVVATNDGIMTSVANDPDSDFRGSLSTTFGSEIETPGTPANVALTKRVAKALAVQKLDRMNMQSVRTGGERAAVDYADASEFTKDWDDLMDWQAATNAQVSDNRLYAIDATNPGGALRSFPINEDEYLHVSMIIYWKAGGSSAPVYVGLDVGPPDHAPAAFSPDALMIGFAGNGARNAWTGSNLASLSPPPSSLRVFGSSPTVDTTFAVSIDVNEFYISFSMRDVDNPQNAAWYFVARSAVTGLGKAINNVSVFLQDARGTSGHSIGPVVAVKSRQPARTKSLGGQTVEGVAPRLMLGATTTSGDAWRIQLPKNYDPRTPSPVVIWCHQSITGDADDPWTETRMAPLTQALADAGFIFASATDTGDLWGNATSLAQYLALYKRVRDNYNTGPLFLMGVSMGALPVLNALAHRTWPTPAAACLIGGVADLDLLWAQSAYNSGIAAAYGISSTSVPFSEYKTKTEGFNPMDREGWEFRGVPLRFYSGSSDSVVPTAAHADKMVAKVLPYSPDSSVVELAGGHLANGHYVADLNENSILDIVEFFQANM